MLILIASSDTCHPQELQVNGTVVPYIQPFAQQMGMANGGKPGGAGVNGKYNEMARMAMSHPAFLNQAEQRPQVVFGSHSQFEVNTCFDSSFYVVCLTFSFNLSYLPEYQKTSNVCCAVWGYGSEGHLLQRISVQHTGVQVSRIKNMISHPHT